MIKFFVKEIINLIFILFLLPLCFVIFILNYNKTRKCDLVIYLKNGGFGHTFIVQDLLRYVWLDKKIVYLQFYDPSRHNLYLNKIFGHKTIVLPTTIYFKFLNTRIGEYEASFFRIIEKAILFFIKNKLSLEQFYLRIEKEYRNIKIKERHNKRWINIYFDLIRRNKKEINFFFKKLKKKKICTIYLRQKYSENDFSNSVRSGSTDPKIYYDMINYLIKKKYIIYLIGDDLFTKENIKYFNSKVFDYRSLNLSKKYFNIYAATNCDLFISEAGGGSYFGSYAKKSVMINCLPYGYKPFNFRKILYKKVFDLNNKLIPYNEASKKFYLSYSKIKYYKIANNSSNELLQCIKSLNL